MLYTAKFVTYSGDEDEDEDAVNNGGGGSSHAGQGKLSATRKSYGDLPTSGSPNHIKPQLPLTARKPRPVSDGIALSGSFQPPFHNSNSTGPPIAAKPAIIPTGGYKGRTREERGVRLQQRPLLLPHFPLVHSSLLILD